MTITLLNRYKLRDEHRVASGAHGAVYRAVDKVLKIDVAIKFLTGTESGRLHRESCALAPLTHPNIVRLYHAELEGDSPFLALEWVDGGTLRDRLRSLLPLLPNPREAAGWIKQLAEGIQYAHSKGVIHRDLNPANILFTSDGVPKITDFGLAKRLGQDWGRTGKGPIGTRNYMPPEQITEPVKAGPAADVYALGAVLYECLTGRPPFGALTEETMWRVLSEEPVPLRRLNPSIPRDLETICLRCLHKEPSRRYATAQDLADDIKHFQNDEPIRARPVGRVEKLCRWARRNPGKAILSATVLLLTLALVAGGAHFIVYQQQVNHALADEKVETERRERESHRNRYRGNMLAVQAIWEKRQPLSLIPQLLEELQPEQTGGTDLRGFEWYYYRRLSRCTAGKLQTGFGPYKPLTVTQDGKVLVCGASNTITVWDLESRDRRTELRRHKGSVQSVAVSPDGSMLASTGFFEEAVHLWDLPYGKDIGVLRGHPRAAWSVAFSPDGRLLASGGGFALGGEVKLWDTASRHEVGSFSFREPVLAVAFSPDGKQLAMGSGAANLPCRIRLLDVQNKRMEREIDVPGAVPTSIVICPLAFSPDGRLLASGGAGNAVRLWDVHTGASVRAFTGHEKPVLCLQFSPDGSLLASGSDDGTIRLWDVASGFHRAMLPGHYEDVPGGSPAQVLGLAFTPDGRRLISGGVNTAVRIWDVPKALADRALVHDGAALAAALSPDEKYLITGTSGGTLHVWNFKTGALLRSWPGHSGPVLSVSVAANGHIFASGGEDGAARIWDIVTGRMQGERRPGLKWVCGVAFSPTDPTLLATAGGTMHKAGAVVFWDLTRNEERSRLEHNHLIRSLAFSPDGNTLASADDAEDESPKDRPPTVRIWDVASGRLLLKLEGYSPVAFSNDGQHLAFGVGLGINIVGFPSGQPRVSLTGHSHAITSIRFNPNNQSLGTSGMDGSVRLWDLSTGKEYVQFPSGKNARQPLLFSSDGRKLISAYGENAVIIRDSSDSD